MKKLKNVTISGDRCIIEVGQHYAQYELITVTTKTKEINNNNEDPHMKKFIKIFNF